MVRKALIPAAGHGTRMAPFSGLVPKELVPIGAVPALQFVLEEAADAGILQVGIVVRPGKGSLIQDFIAGLSSRDGAADVDSLEITWIEQPEANGLGDAIVCAAPFLAGEPFALMLPDNLLLSAEHRLADMVQIFVERGVDVLGVLEVGHEQSEEYGNCGLIDFNVPDSSRPRALHLERLHSKKPGRLVVPPGEVRRRTCGRYICTPEFLTELQRLRRETVGELDEVPGYQSLISERGASGWILSQPVFDIGYPLGYLAACAWAYRRALEDRSQVKSSAPSLMRI